MKFGMISVLMIVVLAASAAATSFVVPTDDQTIARSAIIVAGTIESSYVHQLDTTIVTTYEFRVDHTYKGGFRPNEHIEIVSSGGHIPGVGGTIVHGAPTSRRAITFCFS